MLQLGALAFTNPFILAGLLALPVIYWLLKLNPPEPKKIYFPPVELLKKLVSRKQTPWRVPWWILVLRMLLIGLAVLAIANPILNPKRNVVPGLPLLLVIDNGFASARGEKALRTHIKSLVEQANRHNLPVYLLLSAPDTNGEINAALYSAQDALDITDHLPIESWAPDRGLALEALRSAELPDEVQSYWLSDGLFYQEEQAKNLLHELKSIGPVVLVEPSNDQRSLLLGVPTREKDLIITPAYRSETSTSLEITLQAIDSSSNVLAEAGAIFSPGEYQTEIVLDAPEGIYNRFSRLELLPHAGIATQFLFDESWRRKLVGIVSDQQSGADQPLLDEEHYLERAILPFAEVHKADLLTLISGSTSMIVLPDRGRLSDDEIEAASEWIRDGGVLLRFAGPRLAASDPVMVPVGIRSGDRTLEGALTWSEPLRLMPFDERGIFSDLPFNPEIRVYRQVLATPSPELNRATLIALEDGTPLVTARQDGSGWLILVHTTGNATWSDLPLSGTFVSILERLLNLARQGGSTESTDYVLKERHLADGSLIAVDRLIEPVIARDLETAPASFQTPPGYYAPLQSSDTQNGGYDMKMALNLQNSVDGLLPLDLSARSVVTGFDTTTERSLAPILIIFVFVLLIADWFFSFVSRGYLPIKAAAAVIALFIFVPPHAVSAQEKLSELGQLTRLGFVRTGVPEVDRISHSGLTGLIDILERRTSVEAGEPVEIALGEAELSLFGLIYWAVPPEHPALSDGMIEEVNEYLRQGGMILFDTGDAGKILPGQFSAGPGELRFREVFANLDIGELAQLPPDHVLSRSFYLLQDFPGRYTGRPLWVDNPAATMNDGVASVIIGSHDWAGAWAVDHLRQPVLPTIPGGERQREFARRFGVNLVMYALTGNYKTDQVHIPALLERLGN